MIHIDPVAAIIAVGAAIIVGMIVGACVWPSPYQPTTPPLTKEEEEFFDRQV